MGRRARRSGPAARDHRAAMHHRTERRVLVQWPLPRDDGGGRGGQDGRPAPDAERVPRAHAHQRAGAYLGVTIERHASTSRLEVTARRHGWGQRLGWLDPEPVSYTHL